MAAARNEPGTTAVTLPDWVRVKELLHQAVGLDEAARARYLDEVCASNPALRAELESLLTIGDALSPDFLQSPLTDRSAADAEEPGAAGLAAGQLFEQRFQLVRRLGEGGMGQVWLAEQTNPVQRLVALKLIKAGMYDETVVQRFQTERQSLAIMDHPSIAKVFDAGVTPVGQPYFVMEYVPGSPITEYCDHHKLNIRERVEIFMHACEGVQHAHQKAIIHRDLKPANILVIEVDGVPVPRIIDFGLAKATGGRPAEEVLHTRFGQFLGTPGYMSPEQVDPNIRDIDTRTDVYSLGVVLYVLLTGVEPFETKGRERPSLDEWLRQLRSEEPRRPSGKVVSDRDSSAETAAARRTEPKRLVSLLRRDLDWITMKALDRDRERRYGTPAELAADLKRYLHDEPVVARPQSSAYQLRKFVRRNRVAAVVATMVTTLAIVASGAGLIAVRKQYEAQYQATQALQAQSRLLTQAAAQRLKDSDVAGAQGIILEVLTNPAFTQAHTAAAIGVFQEVRAADAQLIVMSGHGGKVESARYSPDGRHIATASEDGTAGIWDARTGRELAVLTGHAGRVSSAAYSPDGARIVTASEDKTARIWDVRTGAQLVLLAGHAASISTAVYSPDGARILTASEDKTARIWDARTGALLAELSGHGDQVISAAYSPDGTRIVTASGDRTARIWDARTGAQLTVLSGHGSFVNDAAFSNDGTRVVTASADKSARVWDARSGAQLMVLLGHSHAVSAVRYSPDGAHIVTSSFDHTVRIWDASTGAQLTVLSGHSEIVTYAEYSPDGTHIVTSSFDRTARIWDARTGGQLRILLGHRDIVYSAEYSRDGTRIVSASADETARIWDASKGTQVAVLSGHGGLLYGADYSPDDTHIVTAVQDGTARIWDAGPATELTVLSGHTDTVYQANYSPDGARIVTASNDRTARIWDAHSGAQVGLLSGHRQPVNTAYYSPDGTRIVTSGDDGTARIWDSLTGSQLHALSGHVGRVYTAAFSPDGARIVTAGIDKTARIWDARTGAQVGVLAGHSDRLRWAAYSPDGARIVTASNDKSARIWDAHTGAQLKVLAGHQDSVLSARYSPDGMRIVTASVDHTVRIWDAQVPASLEDQIMWVAAAQFEPLREVDRTELGLPPDMWARSWPKQVSDCDRAAAAPYEPKRPARGVLRENIDLDIAVPACSAEVKASGHSARSDYQMGRTLFAKGDWSGARGLLETAVANGQRTAQIDLADLLVSAPANMLDPPRAVSLYEKAWRDGLPIAGFKLGRLYEQAVPADEPNAWQWFQKAADAGEPNALARFAEREESHAFAETGPSKRNALLIQAFRYYAAAAERARNEDWPDDAWRGWRYRRATLARLLAQDGMMEQVATAYRGVLDNQSPRVQGAGAERDPAGAP